MISVNPVSFSKIKVGDKYAINSQVTTRVKYDVEFVDRLNCCLEVTQKVSKRTQLPARDHVVLFCSMYSHLGRICRRNPLLIFQTDLTLGSISTLGTILRFTEDGICHYCGEEGFNSWVTWSQHLVCPSCYADERYSPPFPYGRGKAQCCEKNGCGEQYLNEKDSKLYTWATYQKAQEIFRRRKEMVK